VVSGVQFKIIAERVQYYDKDGKLITESLKDFTRKAVGQEFKSLDQFRKRWNGTERKQVILEELLEKGVILEALEGSIGREMDPFDLICHIALQLAKALNHMHTLPTSAIQEIQRPTQQHQPHDRTTDRTTGRRRHHNH
jgi:type I site-specific restriction endonuclease